MFSDKVLLITGGTGSFGNAVLSRFLETGIREIRIFSRDEKKQDDMRYKLRNEKIKYYIGDVRDYESINKALNDVDYVFHAAALKQVPSCEFYPIQAIKTNILGTENVLNAAIANCVKKVIVLSTDKAVYPINVMGMSKALSEKVMVARSRGIDPNVSMLCATRYGNVMASRGSVIPLFIKQIKTGQPITITDPEMTRFLMSLDEAVELVLFAYENATQGDIFIQKSPASTIGVLAQALKQLFNANNEIKIIGTRHGEKKYETLVNREELALAEDMGDYLRIKADVRDLNYNKYFVEGENKLSVENDYTSHNTRRLDVNEVIEKLKTLDVIQNALKET
jgi:UDP-N-acetylglucosamine 4,6-dehydratase/5-epimerase